MLESVSFYHQLTILSEIKAQHLGIVASIKYVVQHAKEMQPTAELQTVIELLQGAHVAVFIFSTMLVAEYLTKYLFSDRLKNYLAVYFSSWLAILPSILLGIFRAAVMWHVI